MGAVMSIVPVISGVAAIVIFNEPISEALIIGLVLVSLGSWLAHSRFFKRKSVLNESLKIH
jgi:drug/metabolite transporter (DMT)-like permease